jgi:hypothetical protein
MNDPFLLPCAQRDVMGAIPAFPVAISHSQVALCMSTGYGYLTYFSSKINGGIQKKHEGTTVL